MEHRVGPKQCVWKGLSLGLKLRAWSPTSRTFTGHLLFARPCSRCWGCKAKTWLVWLSRTLRKSTTKAAVCELWSKNEQGLQLQKRENSEHSWWREWRAKQQREERACPVRSAREAGVEVGAEPADSLWVQIMKHLKCLARESRR